MSLPISGANNPIVLRDHFKMVWKDLKRDPLAQEHLTRELPSIIAAIAKGKNSVDVEGRQYIIGLKRKDLKPLIKVANKFFSTQHDGLLDSALLENLYTIEKRHSDFSLGTLVRRTEAALTMSNADNIRVKETPGVRAVKNKIEEANEEIKKCEKQRKRAKIVTAGCIVGGAIGLGVLITGLAVLTGGVLIAAVVIGVTLMGAAVGTAALSGQLASKYYLDFDQIKHTYWTHILAHSQTEDFRNYKALQSESVDTDSVDFLEAAALVHLQSKGILDREYYRTNEGRLIDLERKFGKDFQEQNKVYAFSKSKAFKEFKGDYDPKLHSDPDFLRFAYLESLENHTRKQVALYNSLKNNFSGG